MARQRSPDRDKAFEIYKKHKGNIELVEIASQLERPEGTIRGWKNKDKWEDKLNGTFQKKSNKKSNKKTERSKRKKDNKPKHLEVVEKLEVENDDLTEKQRLFCLYYVKSFNATMSAIKAGYSKDTAHVQGPRLLGNVRVKEEILRLKGALTNELFIDAMDVLRKYISIAFADVSDYVNFGNKEIKVLDSKGNPVVNKDGQEEVMVISYVNIKDSVSVDGTLLTEVSKGKDGIKVKLADKMKALEKLEQYFDLLPDKWKRQLEEEKLKIQKEKLELEKYKVNGEDGETEDDGFIEALKGEVGEVWDETEES